MALILVEDFKRYAAAADIGTDNDDVSGATTQWTRVNGFNLGTTSGRFGDQCATCIAASPLTIELGSSGVSGSTLIVAFAVKIVVANKTSVGSRMDMLTIATSASSQHAKVRVNPGGTIYVEGASSGTIITSAAYALTPNVWHYFEAKFSLLDSGSVTIKVDGVTVINGVSGDFRNGTGNTSNIQRVILSATTHEIDYSALVIMDGSGSTFNDFKGDLRMESVVPSADGSTTAWTASAGTRVSCIDDALAAYNDDTDYVSSSVTDDINLATMGTVSASGATTIHCATIMALARSDTTGDKIALVCKSGATTSAGSDIPLSGTTSSAYRWRKRNLETNPNGSIAWTVAALNAAEFGVKKRV